MRNAQVTSSYLVSLCISFFLFFFESKDYSTLFFVERESQQSCYEKEMSHKKHSIGKEKKQTKYTEPSTPSFDGFSLQQFIEKEIPERFLTSSDRFPALQHAVRLVFEQDLQSLTELKRKREQIDQILELLIDSRYGGFTESIQLFKDITGCIQNSRKLSREAQKTITSSHQHLGRNVSSIDALSTVQHQYQEQLWILKLIRQLTQLKNDVMSWQSSRLHLRSVYLLRSASPFFEDRHLTSIPAVRSLCHTLSAMHRVSILHHHVISIYFS